MHPLLRQVRSVGRRAHRYLIYRGLALTIGAVVIIGTAVGLADWWFRVSEPGVRWVLSMLVVAGGIWAFLRCGWPALVFERPEESVAHWIEQRFPDLRDRLSAAVAFAQQPSDDPKYGSAALRQAVMDETAQAAASHDLAACLDPRGVLRAFGFLGAALIMVCLLACVDYSSTVLAASRVLAPWKPNPWPRRTVLVFHRTPHKIAVGEDFVAEITDERGWLPSAVTMLYWFAGDESGDIRRHAMTYAGGKMTHRLPHVTRSFRYRAVGGDDTDMPWRSVEVVEPPRVVDARFQLSPPAYSGLPASVSDRTIRAIAGTTITAEGRSSKTLRSAELQFRSGTVLQRVAAAIEPDRIHFRLPADGGQPWTPTQSGTYHWKLVDTEGVASIAEAETEVEILADSPPIIAVQSPTLQYRFTARAVVPLQVSVRDDLGLQRVVLRIGDQTVTLFERAESLSLAASTGWPPPGEEQVLSHSLDLERFKGATSEPSLAVRLIASDFRSQETTAEVSLSIVSPEALSQELQSQQADLLRRLTELLRVQRALHGQTQVVQRELGDGNSNVTLPIGAASAIELGQRRIADQVAGENGVLSLVSQMLEQSRTNRLDDIQLEAHLVSIEEELHGVQEQLGLLDHVAARVTKLAGLLPADGKPSATQETILALNAALTELAGGQQKTIELLENLVDRLTDWSGYQLLAEEVAQIQREQEEILAGASQLGTSTREFVELTADERRALRNLGGRQSDLAVRLNRLERRLVDMRRKLAEGNTSPTATIEKALDVLDQRDIAPQMVEVSGHFGENRMGVAMSLAQQIIEGLRQLYNILSNRPEETLARTAKQLEEAAGRATQLEQRQRELAERAKGAAELPEGERQQSLDEIASEQNELAAQANQLAESIRQLAESEAAASLEAASSEMQSAQEAAREGDVAELDNAMSRAAMRLADAADALDERASQLEKRQREYARQWLLETLMAMESQQLPVTQETDQFAEQLDNQEPLPEERRLELADLAKRQFAVAETAVAATQRLEDQPGFRVALEQIAVGMTRAGEELREAKIDGTVQRLQQQAHARLRILIEALGEDPAETDSADSANDHQGVANDPGDQDGSNGSEDDNEANPALLAELKMLRGWQMELNRQTQFLLDTQASTGSLSDAQRAEFEQVVIEQRQLAEIIESLMPHVQTATPEKGKK